MMLSGVDAGRDRFVATPLEDVSRALNLLDAAVGTRRGMTVGREGFEPSKAEPADLQSAPFGHLGTDPSADTIAARGDSLHKQSPDRAC